MTDVYALEVQTLFRGVPIACKQVVRDRARRRRALFVVGSTARADAPVAPDFVAAAASETVSEAASGPPRAAHPLVVAADQDGHYAVRLTPRMAGALARAGDDATAAGLVHLPPSARAGFTLHPGDRARIDCGAVTFLLASAPRAEAIDAAPFAWRSAEMRHHVLSALAVTIALTALLYVPEDPRALALDLLARERGWARVLIKAPVVPPASDPPIAAKSPTTSPGGRASAAARGPAGAAGNPTASPLPRRAAARGDTAPSDIPRTAPDPAAIARMGILGYLSASAAARSIFTRDALMGANAADVLGNLVVAPIGDSSGGFGLGRRDTGAAAAGQGEHTIGDDARPLATMSFGGGGGRDAGLGYGREIGGLVARRPPRAPEIIPGIVTVNGALDREILRRIIRRHINEVKYCYERQLLTRPDLGGRILVRFMIGGNGQVLTSVVESSTLGDARVESCTVQAVRRWEFPRPLNGGLVTVSYPFVMTPAASGH